MALHRIIVRLGIHRTIETVVGIGQTMLAGIGLVALSIMVMLPITAEAGTLAREDLAFALSVILLGLLMMISRRNAVSQVIGFMSIENGLILAATGAKGMPLVVEISVAFSILIALIVIGIFLFRIRERFDTVDVHALDGSAGSSHERAGPGAGQCDPARPGGSAALLALSARRSHSPARLNVAGIAAHVPLRRLALFFVRPEPGLVPDRRRRERRVHRAQHVRRLHHQRVQRAATSRTSSRPGA